MEGLNLESDKKKKKTAQDEPIKEEKTQNKEAAKLAESDGEY